MDPDWSRRAFVARSLAGLGALALPRGEDSPMPPARPLSIVCVGGHQTMGFAPTDYVDVTARREKKKAALLAHRSQHGDEILRQHVEIMETFRGREAGVTAAEGFARVARVGPAGLS